MELQAVFIDRDGTLGGSESVVYPGEFELFPFSVEALGLLKKAGTRIFSLTNQPGISRGEATVDDFKRELTSFGFNQVYICPHSHDEGCDCRKPSPGLLLNAANEHGLDLSQCAVIGDRWTDMAAANAAGCVRVLVKTGAGDRDYLRYCNHEYFGDWLNAVPNHVADNFLEAVRWLLGSDKNGVLDET